MKELLENNKTFLKIYGTIIGIIVLLTLFRYNDLTFFFFSILVNVFIVNIIKETKRVLKIEFSKIDYGIIIGIVLIIYLFYSLSLLTRTFIYYWDYECYYSIQIDTIGSFSNGIIDGIRLFVGSTWSGEYGNFLSFIPQCLFQLTNQTANSYVSSCILLFAPYIVISLSILIKKFMEILKVERKELLLGILLLAFILFPMLHATAIFGQPDFFGLFFIFLIVALTLNYEFKELEKDRLILLFLATYCLFICRRWYVYWLVSYFLCYGISILIRNWKDKKELIKILKNAGIFIGISGVLMVSTLFPLIKNILISNYQAHYIYYKGGGLLEELIIHKNRLGTALLLLLIIGFIVGVIKKETRRYSIIAFLQIFIIIFLFTRIQSMGNHHTLTLLPSYACLIMLLILFFEKKKKVWMKYGILGIMILNFINGLIGLNNPLFTNIPLKVPKEEDYKEIEEVALWLKENLSQENRAYMITHTDRYNPDKFRSILEPDRTVEFYLPYGSAIIGVHKFPLELFTATYIITTTPYESMSIEYKYEQVFEELVQEGKFDLEKTFDMNNGYQVLIYKRVREVDDLEIQKYKDILEEESKEFPELYKDVIESY